MGRGWIVLLLCAAAGADEADEASIRAIFKVPAALPGKLDYAEYQKLLAARGYPPERTSEAMFRPVVAQYLADVLHATCAVRTITIDAGGARGEAIVDHEGTLYRWFLVKRDGRWRYCDFEDADYAMRLSDADHVPPGFDRAIVAYRADDLDGTIRILRGVDDGKKSPSVRAARLLLLAHALYLRDDNADALAELARCEALGTGAPWVHLLRAQAAHDHGDHELAVKAARAYVAAVGADADGSYEEGRALLALDRREDAIAAHRAGLKGAPGDGSNVLGLVRALPADRKTEAVDAFLQLDPLDEWFDWIAWNLDDVEDWDSLETLLAAFREKHPDDHRVPRYELALLVGREKYAEAAPRILAFLPRAGDQRDHWARTYLYAMDGLKRGLEGYAALPAADRDATWSYLAGLLAAAADHAGLAKLLEMRGAPVAEDAARALWEIELAWLQKKYDDVDVRAQESGRLVMESDEPDAYRVPDRHVRSLLKLDRHDDALARATGNPFLLFLVHATMGKTDEAVRAFEAAVAGGHEPATFYADPDAAVLLLFNDAYAELRKKYPLKER